MRGNLTQHEMGARAVVPLNELHVTRFTAFRRNTANNLDACELSTTRIIRLLATLIFANPPLHFFNLPSNSSIICQHLLGESFFVCQATAQQISHRETAAYIKHLDCIL